MMEIPNPKFVNKVPGEFDLVEIAQVDSKLAQQAYQRSGRPLKPTGQPKERHGNFFVQGLMLGMAVFVLPVVAGTVFGAGHSAVKLYRYVVQ
jgi:hypothetical protein